MKDLFKGKVGTIIILLATVALAGVAIFTAIRLYQLRSQPVAPNVPSSIPHAQELATASPGAATTASTCTLAFTLTTTTPTPTPSGTPTETPSGTPTPTPTFTPGAPNSCNGTCGSDSNCASGLTCSNGFCRNPSCTTSPGCSCSGTTAPTPTPTAPTLPQSGTDWPTVAGAGIGIFVVIGSILLAL